MKKENNKWYIGWIFFPVRYLIGKKYILEPAQKPEKICEKVAETAEIPKTAPKTQPKSRKIPRKK
ncbi:MAG: hypothetical protein UHU19_05455 [Lachnospiraceae bacterium]|nr:hypothetical protein [Lachnospiraceae bacterium]